MTLALSSCDTREPEMSDDDVAQLCEDFPTMIDECIENARFEGWDALNVSTDVCFPMQNARTWTGLWINEFEGSHFCASPATKCAFPDYRSGTYLSFADRKKPEGVEPYGDGTGYLVEFIGRRTQMPDSHGSDGHFAHEIIVDEMISIKPVLAP